MPSARAPLSCRPSLVPASAKARQGPGAMRTARCVSLEKWSAGVPIGGGATIVPSVCTASLSNRSLTDSRITPAGAAIVRHATEDHFSGRRPRRRGPDVTPPKRTANGGRDAAGPTCRRRIRPANQLPFNSQRPTSTLGSWELEVGS
jgi:hypothetical protein